MRSFLRSRFRTLSDGGYAGLVFLLARSADNPDLHRRFFEEWTDMHDLTRRYLGVITPAPSYIRIDERFPMRNEDGPMVGGLSCLGDDKRLNTPAPGAKSTFRMESRTADERVTITPTLPPSLREHQVALTGAATEMQKFFGISEALLPCAVIVSLQEERAFVVPLNDIFSLYALLKRIKIKLEPVTTKIDMKDAELARAKEARLHLRGKGELGILRQKADATRRNWDAQLDSLADDLAEIARAGKTEDAELCRWMKARLRSAEPLTAEERESARTLLQHLGASGVHGRVPKRLRRTLAKLNAGYPDSHDVMVRFAAVSAEEQSIETRIGQLKAQTDELAQELRLGRAVVDAVRDFGLTPVGPRGLLDWRELTWPTEVMGPLRQTSPERRFPSAPESVVNRLNDTTQGNVVQAGAIHGDVHFHDHTGSDDNT
ncbi:hypothetical protein [Streptomyces sp. NPDC050982]|uniref:hypothetical protein n=1 Tax=Streptomyces sp. NPDC050982 TaxID=3154746 RepID=UPI0033EB7052